MSEKNKNEIDSVITGIASSESTPGKFCNNEYSTDYAPMKDVNKGALSQRNNLDLSLVQCDNAQAQTLTESNNDNHDKVIIESHTHTNENSEDFQEIIEEKVLFSSTSFEIRLSSLHEIESNDLFTINYENCATFDPDGCNLESPPPKFEGTLVITTNRICFEAKQDASRPVSKRFDISVHSSLIGLFALSTDNDHSLTDACEDENHTNLKEEPISQCIYIQFNIPSKEIIDYSTGVKTHPLEMYFFPSNDEDSIEKANETQIDLKNLFDALSKTAELNPPLDDDDDLVDGSLAPWFNFDEDFCMRLNDDKDVGEIIHNSKNDVLKKIDNILVEPKESETQLNCTKEEHDKDGQFDDADEIVNAICL